MIFEQIKLRHCRYRELVNKSLRKISFGPRPEKEFFEDSLEETVIFAEFKYRFQPGRFDEQHIHFNDRWNFYFLSTYYNGETTGNAICDDAGKTHY